jgi:hypothetical protein
MKNIKSRIIGIVLIALPLAGYLAPQYAQFIPIAKDVLICIASDNKTILDR